MNPRFHALIEAFRQRSGVPVVINTSFNVKGEPIVCTPSDALKCFYGTDIDALAIGDFIVWKSF
jgi:carbamoyltransferase